MSHEILRRLFGLDGKVALVTGASGGIGGELAHGLAMAGASVALGGRSCEKLDRLRGRIVADGGEAEAFPADLADLDAIPRLVDDVVERFGGLDVLVNCAGVNKRQPIPEVTPRTFDAITGLNVRSAYFLSQAAFPRLSARGGGKIVHVGSLSSAYGLSDISVYGLTKGAIVQMTKGMAVEWAAHNVQVNCLCPGFIQTELTTPLWTDGRRRAWMLERVLAGRPGTPGDLVGMCLYLAGPASDFTTGQAIYVDGGFLAGGRW